MANTVLKEALNDKTATIAMMVVPTPVNALETDAFTEVIQGLMPMMLLLMYVPIVYN